MAQFSMGPDRRPPLSQSADHSARSLRWSLTNHKTAVEVDDLMSSQSSRHPLLIPLKDITSTALRLSPIWHGACKCLYHEPTSTSQETRHASLSRNERRPPGSRRQGEVCPRRMALGASSSDHPSGPDLPRLRFLDPQVDLGLIEPLKAACRHQPLAGQSDEELSRCRFHLRGVPGEGRKRYRVFNKESGSLTVSRQ